MVDLDAKIIKAHGTGDKAALAGLYLNAALACEHENIEKYCFLLTNAYVCALEAGLDISHDIRGRLVKHGREA